jgi:NADPH:quinone reductase
MAAVNPFTPAGGAQAELIVIPGTNAARIPAELSFEAAATLPMNGLTALEALDQLDVAPGGTLAITGGTGWLATLAIALAKERGLRVIADAPEDEIERVKAFGADVVVIRGDGVEDRIREQAPEGVDAVLDTALIGPSILDVIRDGGRWAVLRFQQDETPRGITRHNIAVTTRMGDTEGLAMLGSLAASGRLPTVVAQTYAPEQAAEAHRRQSQGGVRGRLVIVF